MAKSALIKMIGTSRYVVERTYGGMKGWFGAGNARYRGIKKDAYANTYLKLFAII
jgi:hypothetical protein